MSSYRFTGPVVTLAAGDMSKATLTASPDIDISSLQSFSFHCVWTGTPTGTLAILISNDGVNFDNLNASIANQPAGGASSTMILCYGVPAKWARLQYTKTGGTGSLTVTAVGKSR